MSRIWIAAALACASFIACADGVQGVTKPGDRAEAVVIGALRLPLSAATLSRITLPAYASSRKSGEALAPNQIGVSRKEDVDAQPRITESNLRWQPAEGGFAAHVRIVSPDAAGLRVGLRFTALPRELELRVAEIAFDGTPRVVALTTGADIIKLARGVFPVTHWTASTDGAEQVIELWSPRRPGAAALRFSVDDVSHLLQRMIDPVRSKALEFNCHVDVTCIADADVSQDTAAVARMGFTDGGKSFVCSGSLLTDRTHSLTPLFATANHCISRQEVAATLQTWWFYQTSVCNSATPQSPLRLSHGATLLMANFDTDFTLLQLVDSAPAGAFFLGWDANPLAAGQAVFGIHHPDGSYKRYSSGTYLGLLRVTNTATQVTFAELFKEVQFTQGIIEGGSSGSPLLVKPGTFEGTLFGGPPSTCGGNVFASYSDFTITYPLVKTFLQGPDAGDDYGDSPNAASAIGIDAKLVAQINSDGDTDWFRFTFTQAGQWTISSFDVAPGLGIDVRGEVYAADGATRLASNDDQSGTNLNFSITRSVTPGTYYVRVAGAPGVTGPYGLASSFVPPDDFGDTPAAAANLSINGFISGQLGVLNDQDWFRLTFTEAGTFHVNSTGTTDTIGTLYQADGTTLIAENDDIDPGILKNFTLTINVSGPGVLFLKVTGFDGQKGDYGLQTSFSPASAASANFTDLWWAGASESGWGVNLNHQSDIIFASLFTYAPDHVGMWLVASMTKQADGSFTGALLRTNGPAFNASPWTSISSTQVGTMTLTFADAGHGTLVYTFNGTRVSKPIQRQVFSTPVSCAFTSASRASATNYQDLWWNPAESGWGINFTHQGTLIFATLFTYSPANRDMWLVASLARQSDGSFSGDLLRTTGPSFDTVPWTVIDSSKAGTMRVSFADGVTGTLAYSVDGVSVTKPIQRQVFGTTQTICH